MKLKHRLRRRPYFRRRGVAVVLVLGLLAVTLALSYALVRTQTQTQLVQDNFSRNADAKLAAQAGMARAMQEMTTASWTGISGTVTGSLATGVTYSVTYAVGDSSLTASSPSYSEYPFRVTLTSVGTVVDRDNSLVTSTYTIRSVVQLVRKKMQATPSTWATPQNYTVFQWNYDRVPDLQPPFQVSGNTRIRGYLNFAPSYPKYSWVRTRYFTDLNAMRNAGLGDDRMFTGGVAAWSWNMSSETWTLLTTNLSIALTDTASTVNTAPVNHPGGISTYRLYTGGPTYSVTDLNAIYGSTLAGVTVSPNMVTNPLGIYRASNSITLSTGTKVTGTLLAAGSDDIRIAGTGVQINGSTLPAVVGSTTTLQLPAVLANDELVLNSGSNSAINGLVMCWNQFMVEPQITRSTLALTGRLIVNDFNVSYVNDYVKTDSWWSSRYSEFIAQLTATPHVSYFPLWLSNNWGIAYKPTLTFQPNSAGIQYHWHTWDQPVYIADPADGGLRWNLISWQEGL